MKYFQNKHPIFMLCLFVYFLDLKKKINQKRFSEDCILKQTYTVFLFLLKLILSKTLSFHREMKTLLISNARGDAVQANADHNLP